MKKIFYAFVTILLIFYSCAQNPHDVIIPQSPCDNTLVTAYISLDWSNAYYLCTAGGFGNQKPPNASIFNYTTQVSANGTIGSLSNPNSYLCQITAKNDENASDNCAPVLVGSSTWSKAGSTLAISIFGHENSDVTVDYYDVCGICNNSSPQSARPWFVGTITIPKQALPSSWTVPLITTSNYVGTNCQ